MERFAIKIDEALKLNLYNICRLCGIDNPNKFPILGAITIHDNDEPDLCKKIHVCVGVQVKKNDQMPQNICTLCADKINDFYEYREMCFATNVQTRKLLGLPEVVTGRKKKNALGQIEVKEESILGIDEEDDKKDIKLNIPVVPAKNYKRKSTKPTSRPAKRGKYNKPSTSTIVTPKEEIKEELLDEIKVEEQEIAPKPSGSKKKAKVMFKLPPKMSKTDLSKMCQPQIILSKLDISTMEPKQLPPSLLLTQKTPNKRERKREIEDKRRAEQNRLIEEQKALIEEKKRAIEEQKRLIQEKKLEKKRKNAADNAEAEIAKKLKSEPQSDSIPCTICSQEFNAMDLYNQHLYLSHSPMVMHFGCTSCGEMFKTLDEQKDHHIWHSLSNTMYICSICELQFDKHQTFTRHSTHCKREWETTLVEDITCELCQGRFLTQNLHDWHDCFLKKNGNCRRCGRHFDSRSHLWRHCVRCVGIAPVAKSKTRGSISAVNPVVKSEPEAMLDIDSGSQALEDVAAAADDDDDNYSNDDHHNDDFGHHGNDTDSSDSETEADKDVNNSDKIVDKNRLEITIKSESETIIEADQVNVTIQPTISDAITVKTEPIDENECQADGHDDDDDDDDDDVIFVENDTEPIDISVIDNSPPKKKPTAKKTKKDKVIAKPHVSEVVIKQEPIDDTNEVDGEVDDGEHDDDDEDEDNVEDDVVQEEPLVEPIFDPNIVIKSEPVDSDRTVAKKANKKSKKQKKNKRTEKVATTNPVIATSIPPGIVIKEEPVDNAYERSTSPPIVDSAVVYMPRINPAAAAASKNKTAKTADKRKPTAQVQKSSEPPSISIKSEPLDAGYGDFDPEVAKNIKQEKTDDPKRVGAKQPALRLKIVKKHGTLNAKIIAAPVVQVDNIAPNIIPLQEKTLPIPDEIPAEVAPESSVDATPVVLAKPPTPPIPLKSKKLYKKPALLAMKIKQEMLARMAREKAAAAANLEGSVSVPVISQISSGDGTQIENNIQMPIITNVQAGSCVRTDFDMVRVKEEPKSPTHDVDYANGDDTEECSNEPDEPPVSEEEHRLPTPEDVDDQLNPPAATNQTEQLDENITESVSKPIEPESSTLVPNILDSELVPLQNQLVNNSIENEGIDNLELNQENITNGNDEQLSELNENLLNNAVEPDEIISSISLGDENVAMPGASLSPNYDVVQTSSNIENSCNVSTSENSNLEEQTIQSQLEPIQNHLNLNAEDAQTNNDNIEESSQINFTDINNTTSQLSDQQASEIESVVDEIAKLTGKQKSFDFSNCTFSMNDPSTANVSNQSNETTSNEIQPPQPPPPAISYDDTPDELLKDFSNSAENKILNSDDLLDDISDDSFDNFGDDDKDNEVDWELESKLLDEPH